MIIGATLEMHTQQKEHAMRPLRGEVVDHLQQHAQRLRELRDMTQDRQERRRIDAELDSLQITLSDLEQMDEPQLRKVLARAKEREAEQRRTAASGEPAAPEHAVPPPGSESAPEPTPVPPGEARTHAGLITSYPNRSDWEADVSERAREEVQEGKGPRRTKGPTTEAD